jgi:methyltransferase-like protein/ubiquinone/menaquinone biosynthesis C-methylase UbiE
MEIAEGKGDICKMHVEAIAKWMENQSSEPSAYDVLPYISGARLATHPDRLAVIGRLLGLQTAHPNAARVLELGCGDGGNLIPMAVSLPGSEFVGIDLAATAVERGMDAISSLGLGNVRLLQADIATAGLDLGSFDYVVAHGVYSWVPETVRVALLALIRRVMRPHGLAFVSYNAEPGDHIRGILRGMMRMHTRGIADPGKKVEQARALLGMLNLATGEAGDAYRTLLRSEVGKALRASDHLLYHDDLADISQPFFFTEFIDAAHAAGLEFAAESPFHAMSLDTLPAELAELLGDLGRSDMIAKEQYLDFVTCRGFRQTLLCHAEASVDRAITTDRVRQFRVFSELTRADDDESANGVVTFAGRAGNRLATDSKTAVTALEALAARYPRSVPFDELASLAGAMDLADREQLAEVLFRAFSAGAVGFRLYEPNPDPVCERPIASPWARLHADRSRAVNLYHETVGLDEADGAVLSLLDGRRSPCEIANELGRDEAEVRQAIARLDRLSLLVG